MKYLDLSFASPAMNLACDEALLELCENGETDDALLRIWESQSHFVVLGHANRLRSEVDLTACAEHRISILRRLSGGGAVLQGPGCLNYSLILYGNAHRLRSINDTFRYVLERHRRMIGRIAALDVRIEGISDLAVGGRKISGNAQYRKARCVLVHGTFLLNFDLSMIARFLRMPAKQPAYRQHRPHGEFTTNLNLKSAQIRAGIRESWKAVEEFSAVPFTRMEALVRERYGLDEWSNKF